MFFNRKKQQQSSRPEQKQTIRQNVTYITPTGTVYEPFITLAEQSHLLIAGCTGSGKSVALNGIIASLLQTKSPAKCQFILIDPKRVELIDYKGLPHTAYYASETEQFKVALQIAVNETERRYQAMQANRQKDYTGSDLYIIIDELADLMVTSKKECLPLLQRIAAVGRAAKVHLIVCTQSVLVQFLPSSIRCNIPVTVGLKTANKMQSNFLVQSAGCELLPDPKTTGTGYALIRDGALLEKVRIHKYDDNYIYGLINYWTSKKCIA